MDEERISLNFPSNLPFLALLKDSLVPGSLNTVLGIADSEVRFRTKGNQACKKEADLSQTSPRIEIRTPFRILAFLSQGVRQGMETRIVYSTHKELSLRRFESISIFSEFSESWFQQVK